jgi:anti-sigma28 factor (negative regulator of flagellin synthesis)
MNEITPNTTAATASSRLGASASAPSRPSEAATAATRPALRDAVEISDHAKLLSQLRETPEIREDLVSRVRGEIASGAYLTPDKIDRAADNLADEIDLLG